jgi:hypothetical protein
VWKITTSHRQTEKDADRIVTWSICRLAITPNQTITKGLEMVQVREIMGRATGTELRVRVRVRMAGTIMVNSHKQILAMIGRSRTFWN